MKHFTAEFIGWEEKDKFVEFRLVAAAADELRFDGLTLRRTPEGLRIHLAMRREQQLTEQVMEQCRAARELKLAAPDSGDRTCSGKW